MSPNRIKMPKDPHFAWDYFRTMFPHLFIKGRPRFTIVANDILKPLEKSPIGETFAWGIFRLVTDYPDHFATAEDARVVRQLLTDVGVDMDSWMNHQRKALARLAKRFGDTDAVAKLTPSERHLVHRILDWRDDRSPTRLPLEIVLWNGKKMRRHRIAQLATLMLKLPDQASDAICNVLAAANFMHLMPLPSEIAGFLDLLAREPSRFFSAPSDLLYEASSCMAGVASRQNIVRTYLPAFMHAMATPARLVEVFASLPPALGAVAPPPPRTVGWSELADFLVKRGVRPEGLVQWFAAVGAEEHELISHLAIACSSLLRSHFSASWKVAKAARDEGGRYPYYEDFLEDVARRTKLTVEDLDAWLNMRYVEPQPEHDNAGSTIRRAHASADREAFGRLLRERTMMLDLEFDMMRGLDHRLPSGEQLCEAVVQKLQDTRNRFASYHSVSDKKGKIVEAIATLDLSVAELCKLCAFWRKEKRADERSVAFIEEVLMQAGFQRTRPPTSSKRIRQAVRRDNAPQDASLIDRATAPPGEKRYAASAGSTMPKLKPELRTGHDVELPVRYSTDVQRLEQLSEVVEAVEDYFGSEYERLTEWVDSLQALVANGKVPTGGIAQLEANMRSILEERGLDLDALVRKHHRRGGNKGGSSSPTGGSAPTSPVAPPTMTPVGGTHFFRGALPLVPFLSIPTISAVHLPTGMLLR